MPTDSLWGWIGVALAVAQFAFSVLLGVIGYLLKRQIDQNDRKIEAVCKRLQEIDAKRGEGEKASIIYDGLIREKLAAGYVSKAECARCAEERRDTTTRIFTKVEQLQEGQAKMEGKLDAVIRLAGGRQP